MSPAPAWTKSDVEDLVDLIMNGDKFLHELKLLESELAGSDDY